MHGSFAETYKGHGTDKALLAGIQGIRYDDERLKQAYELAAEKGIERRSLFPRIWEMCIRIPCTWSLSPKAAGFLP